MHWSRWPLGRDRWRCSTGPRHDQHLQENADSQSRAAWHERLAAEISSLLDPPVDHDYFIQVNLTNINPENFSLFFVLFFSTQFTSLMCANNKIAILINCIAFVHLLFFFSSPESWNFTCSNCCMIFIILNCTFLKWTLLSHSHKTRFLNIVSVAQIASKKHISQAIPVSAHAQS